VKTKHLRTLLLTTLLSGAVSLVPNSVLARGGGGSHGGGSHSSSYSSGSRGGSIHVSGYTRSNGTYVHSYTRATSRSGLGYSTGSQYSDDSGESSNTTDPNSISTTSNNYQDALDSAMSAATVTQSAVSKDDWELVSSKWENAIFLLKELPNSSPNYVEAQVKIQEYGRNLNYARKQLDLPPLTEPNEESSTERLTSVASVATLATPQATAVTSSVSRPSQVTPPPATGVTPTPESDESSYPIGAISLIVLIVAGVGFYKASTLAKATRSLKSNAVSVTPTNNLTTQLSDQKIENDTKSSPHKSVVKSTDSNQEAIEHFTQAIRLNPDAKAYFRRGEAYENLGSYKEALKDFNQAISLNHAQVNYYTRRGIVRQKLGDTLGANWDSNTVKTLLNPSIGSTEAKYYVRQSIPAKPKKEKVSDESEDYYFEKEFKLPEFHVPEVVNRVGSIALGLGALVAFGLINQKMGGGAVQVSSYHKKNGTFVHSHTRHRPR